MVLKRRGMLCLEEPSLGTRGHKRSPESRHSQKLPWQRVGKAAQADAEPDTLNHYELHSLTLTWSEQGNGEQATEEVVGVVQELSAE